MAIDYKPVIANTRKFVHVSELFGYDSDGTIISHPWDSDKDSITWHTDVDYRPGDFVSVGGDLYYANAAHRSTDARNPVTDSTNWTKYLPTIEWASLEAYSRNQFVSYNGELYVAQADVTSATPPVGDSANWELYVQDSDKLLWNANNTYATGQFTNYNGRLYVQTGTNYKSSTVPSSDTNWTLYTVSSADLDSDGLAWSAAKTYELGQFVSFNNQLYYSNTAGHTSATNPPADTTNWTQYSPAATGANPLEWVAAKAYVTNEFVSRNGALYYSNTDHTSATATAPEAAGAPWTAYESGGGGDSDFATFATSATYTAAADTIGATFTVTTAARVRGVTGRTVYYAVYHEGIRLTPTTDYATPVVLSDNSVSITVNGPVSTGDIFVVDISTSTT